MALEYFDSMQKMKITVNCFRDTGVWIGLHRKTIGGEQWADAMAPSWSNYAPMFPTIQNETMCFIFSDTGQWIENDCSENLIFVCETDLGM